MNKAKHRSATCEATHSLAGSASSGYDARGGCGGADGDGTNEHPLSAVILNALCQVGGGLGLEPLEGEEEPLDGEEGSSSSGIAARCRTAEVGERGAAGTGTEGEAAGSNAR